MPKKVPTAMIKPDHAHAMMGGKDTISRRAFYNALKRNEIPHQRLGRRILIPRQAFEKWIEGAKEPTGGVAA